LYRKTSGSGKTYYVGRWGAVRVLILENGRHDPDSDDNKHTHALLLQQVEDAAQPSRQNERGHPSGQGGQPPRQQVRQDREPGQRRFPPDRDQPQRRPQRRNGHDANTPWPEGNDPLPF
jgi:hypothetical protein